MPSFILKAEKSKVFSLFELKGEYTYFTEMKGTSLCPFNRMDIWKVLLFAGQKIRKVYDHKDVKVLELLAKRINALVFTAKLYKKDLENQLALFNERHRISRDMHDELGAGLTKITMLSELPSLPDSNKMDAFNRLNKISVSARDLVSKLNVIIWALNPNYNNLESLIGYIRRYFGDFLENTGIDFRISNIDNIPDIRITPEYRRNVYYSVQEAVNNAVKHSSCTQIAIHIALKEGFLKITINDNGIGFNPEKT
ncbi:MAG: hypothetical protein IPH57_02635 [Saprospiraceae bacterium]|nr:hypothetical protein [Saprospiraceae bacterium]